MNDRSDDKIDTSDDKLMVTDYTIMTLFDLVRSFILNDKSLSIISLVVDIVEFKEYKGMAFLRVKDDTASISAIIYKSNFIHPLEANNKIKIVGSLDIYRGQIQLNIRSYQKMETIQLDKLTILKNKLAKLGYFDNKPILENNYDKIGIISSLNAAGLKDFLSVIMQRCYNKKLYIYPSSVQGKDAVEEICDAIDLANRHAMVEILVMVRGGGAKEDLECFNSELLAEAIHRSKIPIITGIGHQIDTSIADLVCAKAYITPTAVAQNITVENINSKQTLNTLVCDIRNKLFKFLNKQYQYLLDMEKKLSKYCNNLLENNNEILLKNRSNIFNTKKRIFSYMNSRFDYLTNSEKEISIALASYCHFVNNKIKLCQNYYTNKKNVGRIIQIYEDQLNILSKPYILDKSKKEVKLVKDLIKGKKYQIHFIDGVYDLNL